MSLTKYKYFYCFYYIKSTHKETLTKMQTEVLKSFEFKIRKASMIGHVHVGDYSRIMLIVSIPLCPRKAH